MINCIVVMATVAPTTTSFQLQPDQASSSQQINARDGSTAPDSDGDVVLQASRDNDSAVPDGGYGWVVVGGCAVVSWWMLGTPYSWGVMQGALVDEGISTPAVLSFVGSLAATLISALAIVNSRVMRMLGPQKTGMLGISLLSLGGILSSFAFTNIGALFATSGVVTGLGLR